MPLRLPVDVRALTVAYLKAHTSVVALVGSRVTGRAGATFPQVTVTVYAGRPVVAPPGVTHLDEQYVQVDSWGEHMINDANATSVLARTVHAALLEMPDTVHTRGDVTHVRVINTPHDFADENDRARMQAEYGVFVHPNAI